MTTNWKKVEEAIGILAKREKRKDRMEIQRTLQTSKEKIPAIYPTSTIQPSMATSKREEMGIDEII